MAAKQSAEDIFNQAVGLTDPEKQAEFLDRACGGDEKLWAQVEALLKWHREAGSFLEVPAVDPNVTLDTSASGEGPGATIGRYKLLEKVGEGGMATVYMAEQKRPIRRRVALKIIRLGMDTKQVIGRFEAERQALAMMDHPNIAKVFDAGTTETGRPYFVMELVRGVPITEFCDRNNLTTQERLGLFMSVCQAVQHAHQRGIIHRDIKPSNILVTLHDGEPVAKVIDFGIAKAVNQQLTEKTVFTRYSQMIGTPEYMSPEQAEMSGLDIDTRTDVFSLGVLLYELLTGTTPFDSEYLLSKGYGEMQRIIREEEPTRPSTKLSTMGKTLTDIARHRRTSPELLCKLIRTDLDWIVMKTLEKDRSRRYESVSELAADVRRHLDNEPVLAGRPSALYKIQKFVKRNRTLCISAAAVFVILLLAIAFSYTAFLKERSARIHAAEAEIAREEARRKAYTESVRADEVVAMVEGFLDTTIPRLSQHGHEEAIRQMLTVLEDTASNLRNAPIAEAKLRIRLGKTFRDRNLSAQQFRRARELGSGAGELGRPVAELAHAHLLSSTLSDPNVEAEFRQMGEDALSASPPNLPVAAYVLSRLAQYHIWNNNHMDGLKYADKFMTVIPNEAAYTSDRLTAAEARCNSYISRQEWPQAANAAKEAVEMFGGMRPGEDFRRKEQILRMYARVAAIANEVGEFEATLAALDSALPKNDLDIRTAMEFAHGESLVRIGRLEDGFELMRTAGVKRGCSIIAWQTATLIARLLNDKESYQRLVVYGLARFAGGADDEISFRLYEHLSDPWSGLSSHPILRELEEQAYASPRRRKYQLLTRAWKQSIEGRYDEAEQTIDSFIADFEDSGRRHEIIDGYFVQSNIKAQVGKIDAAIEAYRQGMSFASRTFFDQSVTYEGRFVDQGLWIEISRRDAAALLKEHGVMDDDGYHLKDE